MISTIIAMEVFRVNVSHDIYKLIDLLKEMALQVWFNFLPFMRSVVLSVGYNFIELDKIRA